MVHYLTPVALMWLHRRDHICFLTRRLGAIRNCYKLPRTAKVIVLVLEQVTHGTNYIHTGDF
ncbi:hypothetical protein K443DRAFT_280420 [Laccaria amethystina LaAM-08-1]|uniref:Uncharacterized protein n=1 Tax=Laccaria amethystina LaAM-08-1 TaxID=1095629 RepID=A0A0C9X2T0_9AGAR|nr:hypothetical protein K443DRAFT_280420 [Laccaria amethystina LaAM-08-1]